MLGRVLAQSFFISAPTLTEKNLPDQSGKVFIITGANSGVGYEVAKILYAHNGTVYIGARSEPKAREAMSTILKAHPDSKGRLEFLHLNLSDLSSIKKTVHDFENRETKLHWLNNNAGVMIPPQGSKGEQGLELQFQTNVLGPFLLTKLLHPLLKRTADSEAEKGSVRVSWAGSVGIETSSPKNGITFKRSDDGMGMEPDLTLRNDLMYGQTKVANLFFAWQFGKRLGDRDGVLHDAYNPGNLSTGLQRHADSAFPAWFMWFFRKLLHPSIYGAYTEMFSGLSPELTLPKDQGAYLVPWGKTSKVRPDIEAQRKEGGAAEMLYDWCEKVTKEYA